MNLLHAIMNAARRMDAIFPGFFAGAKHQHYRDFGYPETVDFDMAYRMYRRHSIARAAVNKTVLKTWQDFPAFWETEAAGNTTQEKTIETRMRQLGMWRALAEADRRAIVGGYAGVILRIADSKQFHEPVERVIGGLDALVEVIPVWANQLTVTEWDADLNSENYGLPKMFTFNEAAMVGTPSRNLNIHPSRVLIWSADGKVSNHPDLEPGYNDLLVMEKVSGAGGEGFWKNAKSAPVLEVDKEAKADEMARAMGVDADELADEMNKQVEDWQKGFDKLLMIQGMQAKTLNITLPSPEHFHGIPLLSFAASMGIPSKILIGSQTGSLASTEDAKEWSQTCNARRENIAKPRIKELADRLVEVGIFPDADWYVGWSDLTEASRSEKLDRAGKMADINQKGGAEPVYTPDEIREESGYDPAATPDPYDNEE